MQRTGVGEWLKLECEKLHHGACFCLGERSLTAELGECRFIDIKVGDSNILEACLITLSRRELCDRNNADKKFYLEEITVIYPDGLECELVGTGYVLRANYDAHNRYTCEEYERRRELKKLLLEKEELDRQITKLTMRSHQR